MKSGNQNARIKGIRGGTGILTILMTGILTLVPQPLAFLNRRSSLATPFLMAQSGTGGSGSSMVCAGYAPLPCARTDRSYTALQLGIPTPQRNAPYVNAYGEREVRATDYTVGGYTAPVERFTGNSADYYDQWGIYDATLCSGAGGYRFYVLTKGHGTMPMEFCPKTFTAVNYPSGTLNFAGTGGEFAHTDPAAVFGVVNNSTQLEMYCFPDAGTNPAQYPLCSGKAGTYTNLYNYASCPNLPQPLGGAQVWVDPPSVDVMDNIFTTAIGGQQDDSGDVLWWNRSNGNCDWIDTNTLRWGGTGQTATGIKWQPWTANTQVYRNEVVVDSSNGLQLAQSNFTTGVSAPASWNETLGGMTSDNGGTWKSVGPTANGTIEPFDGVIPAPACAQSATAGTIPAGAYDVAVTYAAFDPFNLGTESGLSAICTVTVDGAHGIDVKPAACYSYLWCGSYGGVSLPNGETPKAYAVYMAPHGSTPTLQQYVQVGTGDGSTLNFSVTQTIDKQSSIYAEAGSGAWNLMNAGNPWGSCCGTNQGRAYWGPGAIASDALSATAASLDFGSGFAPPSGAPVWIRWFTAWNGGSAPTTTITQYVNNGPSAPTVWGGGVNLHDGFSSRNGRFIYWGPNQGSSWGDIGGNVFDAQTGIEHFANSNMGMSGHVVTGFNSSLGVDNGQNYSNYQFAAPYNYALSNLLHLANYYDLMAGPPGGSAQVISGTQHIAWTDNNNGEDNYPAVQGNAAAGQPHFLPQWPLDASIWAFSTDQAAHSNTVWRLAQTRTSGWTWWGGCDGGAGCFWNYTFGSPSQDGKFVDYSTDFNERLGWLLPTWANSSSFSQGGFVIDPNGNLDLDTAAGSCSTASTGTMSIGTALLSTAIDNTCHWTVVAVLGQNMFLHSHPNSIQLPAGVTLWDSSGNLEIQTATVCFTGSSAPTWPGAGSSVADNTCSWTNLGATGDTSQPGQPESRTDVFIVAMQ